MSLIFFFTCKLLLQAKTNGLLIKMIAAICQCLPRAKHCAQYLTLSLILLTTCGVSYNNLALQMKKLRLRVKKLMQGHTSILGRVRTWTHEYLTWEPRQALPLPLTASLLTPLQALAKDCAMPSWKEAFCLLAVCACVCVLGVYCLVWISCSNSGEKVGLSFQGWETL